MPGPAKLPWFKWFPKEALTDPELRQLSWADRGLYHILLDWAALTKPASKRGWLYLGGSPMSLNQLANCIQCDEPTLENGLATLLQRGLIARNTVGAWGFPNFRKYQRHMTLLRRAGTTKTAPKQHQQQHQNSTKKAPPDVDVDVDVEVPTPTPPLPGRDDNSPVPRDLQELAKIIDDINCAAPLELQQLAFQVYRHTPSELGFWWTAYPQPWVSLAIRATQQAGKRSPAYTHAILERWRKEGGPPATGEPQHHYPESKRLQ